MSKTAAQYLTGALELLDNGKHWGQGRFIRYNPATGDCVYCAAGALMEQARPDGRVTDEHYRAKLMLDDVAGEVSGYRSVIDYNDQDGRTWKDIESLFKVAIERVS